MEQPRNQFESFDVYHKMEPQRMRRRTLALIKINSISYLLSFVHKICYKFWWAFALTNQLQFVACRVHASLTHERCSYQTQLISILGSSLLYFPPFLLPFLIQAPQKGMEWNIFVKCIFIQSFGSLRREVLTGLYIFGGNYGIIL